MANRSLESIEKRRIYSKLYQREYRKQHHEECILKLRKYYSENREKYREYGRKFKDKNRDKLLIYYRKVGTRFSVGKSIARLRHLEWSIPFSEFKEYLSHRCHYCDGVLSETGCGLDRMDNAKGYVIGNVVPCCSFCNRMKGHLLTHDEMVVAMRAIREFRLSKILVK